MLIVCILLLVIQIVGCTHIDGTVNIDCGTPDTEALINYYGDPYGVLAVTKNGSIFWFNEDIASATYTLTVKYSNSTEDEDLPIFDKHPEMNLYTITVQARMMFRDFEDQSDENFLIECNFEAYVDDVAGKSEIEDAPTVPKVVRKENGIRSESNFSVSMVRIDGSAFDGYVAMGRWVMLKTLMTPASGDTDYTVNMCFAYAGQNSSSEYKVAILVEGCGTGMPFSKEKGFLKDSDNPLVAFSPKFRTFIVRRGEDISFTCDFIICENNTCGMSSCAAENEAMNNNGVRRRRSVVSGVHTRVISTKEGRKQVHFHEVNVGDKVQGRKIIKTRTQPIFIDMSSFREYSNSSSNGETAKVVGNVEFVTSRRMSKMEFKRKRQQTKFRASSKEFVVVEEEDLIETSTQTPDRMVINKDEVSTQKERASMEASEDASNTLKSNMNSKIHESKFPSKDIGGRVEGSSQEIMVVVIVTVCVVVATSLTLSTLAAYVVTKRMVVRTYAPRYTRESISMVSYRKNRS